MKYKDQLERVKYLKESYIKSMERMDNTYSPIMDDTAKLYNRSRFDIRLRDYDREIQRLQQLADKEREEEIYKEALQSITIDTKQVEEALDKCLSETLKSFERHK